jgi:hypothetical protein
MEEGRTQRKDERIVTALPVKLGEAVGLTRDVSAAGIFFEIDAACTVGSVVSFEVELETPTGKIMLRCKGNIIRTEPCNNKLGVAVRITESVLDSMA